MNTTLNNFVIVNPNKCIGCKVCEVACFVAHSKNNGVTGVVGSITTPITPRLYTIKVKGKTIPIQCRHCEDAPCANSCPENAITQENGSIIIDDKNCVGCKNCVLACPFGAISLMPEYQDGKVVIQAQLLEIENELENKNRIIAYKCDLCKDSKELACVKACPQKALSLVNLSEVNQDKRKRAAEQLSAMMG